MTARPFPDGDGDRFSAWLRDRAAPSFGEAVDHRFVENLSTGELADAVFRPSLVRDYASLSAGTRPTGHALGRAPTRQARREPAWALETLAGPEDEYFERAFDALDVPAADRGDPDLSRERGAPATGGS